MKTLITILFLTPLLAFAWADFRCPPHWTQQIECGDKWKLQWEIGERIKHASKQNDINKLKTLYGDMATMDNKNFTQTYGDSVKAQFPADSYFDATSSPVGSQSGSANKNLLVYGGLGALILSLVVWVITKRKQNVE